MDDVGVIDRFTDSFARYIDSGFGLVGGEVQWLSATLIAIDVTLAALFWALGGADDIIARLIKKTLYVGAFAYIISNFNGLARIIFESFAGLGLTASGSRISAATFLQPSRLAAAGIEAARPIMDKISTLTGFPDLFANIDTVAILFLAWTIVIISFFLLAVQLFVAIIEFKLTTLAGFVLVPFALWSKTSFLAERVLGNVVSSGVKILVLAVIVGIGTGLFDSFETDGEPTTDQAFALILASLALLGLGIFGPRIAGGLIAGGPQLGAGTAVGTGTAAAGMMVAGGAGVVAGARLTSHAVQQSVSAAASLSSGARAAYAAGSAGRGGIAGVRGGLMGVAQAGAGAVGDTIRHRLARNATAGQDSTAAGDPTPAWAARLKSGQRLRHGAGAAIHALRTDDHGGASVAPSLKREED